ncbi:MAG TPA: shikimate dehydrogenase [Armatimonadota bacterium]|jgi:shikimate dehydrogenase
MIRGTTALYGVTGYPVTHSISPAMHNAAFAALGLDAVYVPFPIAPEDLEQAVRGLFAAGLKGLNVTVPHKEAMLTIVDDLSPVAAGVGAVNTVWMERGVLKGDNTDVAGILRGCARDGVRLDGLNVILGAGGAARAAVQAVMLEGGRAILLNRTVERAEALALATNTMWEDDRVEAHALYEADARIVMEHANALLNCTSVGLKDPEATPFPWAAHIRPECYVFDTIYAPPQTRLLREAEQRGCRTRNGLAMLVEQGVESFRIWTGREPRADIMEAAALSALGI